MSTMLLRGQLCYPT